MITIEKQKDTYYKAETVHTYYIYHEQEVYQYTTSIYYSKLILKGLTKEDNKILLERKQEFGLNEVLAIILDLCDSCNRNEQESGLYCFDCLNE